MYAQEYRAFNEPFHNPICGKHKKKIANEEEFPHFLPLKEGDEGSLNNT